MAPRPSILSDFNSSSAKDDTGFPTSPSTFSMQSIVPQAVEKQKYKNTVVTVTPTCGRPPQIFGPALDPSHRALPSRNPCSHAGASYPPAARQLRQQWPHSMAATASPRQLALWPVAWLAQACLGRASNQKRAAGGPKLPKTSRYL